VLVDRHSLSLVHAVPLDLERPALCAG